MLISGLLAMVDCGFMREIRRIAAWARRRWSSLYAFSKLLQTAKTYFNNDTVASVLVVVAPGCSSVPDRGFPSSRCRISDMIWIPGSGRSTRTLGFLFGLARGPFDRRRPPSLFFSWLVPDKAAAGLGHRGPNPGWVCRERGIG